MKRLKRIMALVIAMVMVLGCMSMSAFADAPTSGSLTVNSPLVGATYKVYKVFDMTINEAKDAFSYTIDENSKFYGAVVAYANVDTNGLTLTRIKDSDPATYNVSIDESKFKAQTFGKAMQAVLANGSPAVTADTTKGIVAKEAANAAIAENASKVATITTDNTSDFLKFESLPLGYYLVNPTYPSATAATITLGTGDNAKTFTEEDLVKEDGKVKEPRELVAGTDTNGLGKKKIAAYVNAVVTDSYVEAYLADNGIKTNKDGSPLNATGKGEYKTDIIASLKADAEEKVLAAFNNNASEADINVKDPILVFLDSSQPDAVINEKNELDKWDIPVNPSAGTTPGSDDDTPDHGEPAGGKNIVVKEAVAADNNANPPVAAQDAVYGDWSEAEIGESVHYQLRVNAMNFIRTGDGDSTVQQVKEYFFADYQSAHMHFDETKGLKVSVWAGDNANNSQASTKENVTKKVVFDSDGTATVTAVTELNYTDKAKGDNQVFFKNSSEADGQAASFDQDSNSIFADGTGIMVPWVIVSKENLSSTYPVYTTTNIPKFDESNQPVYKTEAFKLDGTNKIPVKKLNETTGDWEVVSDQYVSVNNRVVDKDGYLLDENGNKIQATEPVYTYSLYNSDVTIVVDYWMILDDDAIVDEPGNKNFAQYGWSPVDNDDGNGNPKAPTNPSDDSSNPDKPSKKEKVDEATVYTFALAWVKVDEQAKALANAEFELPFYVKKTKDGDSYVYAFKELTGTNKDQYPTGFSADNSTNKVTTTSTGVITIKGVEQGTYSITETKAPTGYNSLIEPFNVEAKKSGPDVTTKTNTTIYLDKDGNVTETVTTATEKYNTDKDSYTSSNNTSVPVYQFNPVVNKQGTELPSTGGIGTTIFYVVGAILVIGAGVVLITRRRMDS